MRWIATSLIVAVVSHSALAESIRYYAGGTATAVTTEDVFHQARVVLTVLVDTDTAAENVGPDYARYLLTGPARLIFARQDGFFQCLPVPVPVECYVYNDASIDMYDALVLSVVDFRLPGSKVDLCTFAGANTQFSMWDDVSLPTVFENREFTHTEGFLSAILDGYDSYPLYQLAETSLVVRENVAGDVEGDGDVTQDDLAKFDDALTTGDLRADFNLDCRIDLRDFALLQNHVTTPREED